MRLKKSKNPIERGPVLFVVLDGIAIGQENEGNAVHLARTPNLDSLFQGPWVKLKAHGTAVGMPSDKDMGNSEVGHNTLGAGRVFAQGAKLVSDAITSGALFEGDTWKSAIQNCAQHNSTLHLLGLLSDGNVHSHEDHLHAMITKAEQDGVSRLRVHVLLDGRDVSETSSPKYVKRLEELLQGFRDKGHDFQIASGGGRMLVTMDRYDADWAMVERGWHAHVLGKGRSFSSALEAIETYREELDCNDQYLPAFVIADDDGPVGKVADNDSFIFFNFRGDRAIEFCKAFEMDDFHRFSREYRPKAFFAGMMQYDGDEQIPAHYLVAPPRLESTISEFLAQENVRQWACSETQKYGHVTYFWNGNRSGKFSEELETYVEIPSDLETCEYRPWMKAAEITDTTMKAMMAGDADFYRINFPNGDMVGHTGNVEAARLSVECVDLSLGRILECITKLGGVALVTADHGNCDQMFELNKDGSFALDDKGKRKAKTSHTLNPVPFFIFDPLFTGEYSLTENENLGLANIASTILNFLGFEAPENYEQSLIEIHNGE